MAGCVLLLAGCSATPTSESDYLDAVSGLDSFSHMSDTELITYGEAYCEFLTQYGEDSEEGREKAAQIFLQADVDNGGNLTDTAYAVGNAVKRFCPEYAAD